MAETIANRGAVATRGSTTRANFLRAVEIVETPIEERTATLVRT